MFGCHYNDCVKVGNDNDDVGDSGPDQEQQSKDAWGKKFDTLRAIEVLAWVGEWELAQQPEGAVYSKTTVFWQGNREFDVNMTLRDP